MTGARIDASPIQRNPLGWDLDEFIACDGCGADATVWDGPANRWVCPTCLDKEDQ